MQEHDNRPRLAILFGAKSTADPRGSIATQLADARVMAEREGFCVVESFEDEGKSAYSGNRGPGLAAAKSRAAELAAEGADVAIFVQHSDRLARGDGLTALQVIDHVRDSWRDRYALRSVEDDYALTEPTGLMAYVMGVRNHEDSKRKGAATAAGLRRAVEAGRWHGSPPYGYRALGLRDERRLVVAKDEAMIVARIYREYVEGSGIAVIAHRLTTDGVHPPRGERWDRHSTANIIDSPAYIGKVRFKGEIFQGMHEAIVGEETWHAAQAERKRRRAAGSAAGRPPLGPHLFVGGLLRCGGCGGYVRARTPRGCQPRYECATRSRTPELCSMPGILQHLVDEPFLEYLSHVVFDIEATREAIAAETARRSSESAVLTEQAERAVAEAESALSRIRADYRRGALAAEDWESFRDELTADREAAAAESERLRARAQELADAAEAVDVDVEAAERLAFLRAAVAGEISNAEGLTAVRAALARVFAKVTLVKTDDGLVLVPAVREFSEIESWIGLRDGRCAIKPLPQTLALPEQQRVRAGT